MCKAAAFSGFLRDSSSCTAHHGGFGADVWCFDSEAAETELHPQVAGGICGSGRQADCNGYYHMVGVGEW